jgi:intraflagellar transport protein 20
LTSSVSELGDFRTLVCDVSRKMEKFSEEIQFMKMLAINQQNLSKSSVKQRMLQKQHIQTKLIEKSLELDRLKTELQSFQRCESEAHEIMENFHQNQ